MKRRLALCILFVACGTTNNTTDNNKPNAVSNTQNTVEVNTPPKEDPVRISNPIPARLEGFELSLLSESARQAFWDAISETPSPCDRPETLASCVRNEAGCLECSYVAKSAFRIARDQEVSAEELASFLEQLKESVTAKPKTFSLENVPMKGNPNASIKIVEFADFQCPTCALLHGELKKVLPDLGPDVAFYFKNLPLVKIHEFADPAARASLAAKKQNKFWEYQDILFTRQDDLNEENLMLWAKELGLDMKRFETDYSSEEIRQQVNRDVQEAQQAGLPGTPSLFVDGILLNQYDPESIRAAIQFAIAKKK